MKNEPSKEPEVEDENVPESSSTSGVIIPEEFQQKVHALVHKAPKEHLDHIRNRVYAREDDIRKEEEAKRPKKDKGSDMNFSVEDMPQSD